MLVGATSCLQQHHLCPRFASTQGDWHDGQPGVEHGATCCITACARRRTQIFESLRPAKAHVARSSQGPRSAVLTGDGTAEHAGAWDGSAQRSSERGGRAVLKRWQAHLPHTHTQSEGAARPALGPCALQPIGAALHMHKLPMCMAQRPKGEGRRATQASMWPWGPTLPGSARPPGPLLSGQQEPCAGEASAVSDWGGARRHLVRAGNAARICPPATSG